MKLKRLTVLVITVAMCALIMQVAAQPIPSSPFLISGWVNYSNGAPVNNPTVTIENLNTSEVFTAKTNEGYSYHRVSTSSNNVSNGNILHFNASNGNVKELNHTVTKAEINSSGGFIQNITISGIANHVVISEICIDAGDEHGSEWVELYNPTGSPIVMTDWHWCYFSSSTDWNNPSRNETFLDGATIPKHGFYLILVNGTVGVTFDWNLAYGTNQLSDTAGSIGIFPFDPDTKTADEAKKGRIDAVGWGSDVEYVYETVNVSVPGSGESLQRKINATIAGDGYGPAWDTNNNSADFFIQTIPNPQNTETGPVPPIPELPTLILFSSGLIILVGYVLLKRRK